MEIKNIKLVHPISEYNSLAQIECIHEDLKSNYRKYEIFFLNKENNIVAHFEYQNIFSVEQLLAKNEYLFDVIVYADKNMECKLHQIVRVKNGKQAILNTYDDIEHGVEDGTFAVKKNGLWGFIDIEGNEIITPQYEKYSSFKNGIAIVRKNRNSGYINKKGEEITPLKYWKCQPFYGNITIAQTHDLKTEVIDKNGNILFESEPYQEVFNLGNDSILIENKEHKFEIVQIKEQKLYIQQQSFIQK